MFNESVQYLKDSDDAVTKVLIGGLLVIFGFLIIPAILLEGYMIRVLREVSEGDTEAPMFDEWTKLFVDGLKALVITFIYLLVPTVIAFVFIGGGAALANNSTFVGGFVAVVGSVLTFLAGIAVWYTLPAALVRFAEKNTMGSAFEYESYLPILRDRDYATGWLIALAVVVVTVVVVSAIAAVPIIGWVVGAFVAFYAHVMVAFIYGTAYAEADEHRLREGPEVEEGRPAV
ncbi:MULTISPECIES: DUF4013 domain-containing protein [unclassified Haladaptatus]|uniref:DUF4013 domain-containing protein n=1 Tax=unclassified Haladaptatus TaxID=2622732 RepID=UPI00209C01E9|nr:MULTISPECIES: DUF4013 domain-containing protein [unclassified Haladaptatus]MCO8246022.1 DUF4013 domain-containing protein [Haladaptatus sp. AB643]MCO8254357.1 DUF4013 domain-containing protein [Haladaptatus sp. AB618]